MAIGNKKDDRRRVSARKYATEHESGISRTSLKVPDGCKLFSPKKAGVYKINVVPYDAGEGNPFADAGEYYFERTYYTHPRIGPNNDTYVCPARTFGKSCPVCEHSAKLRSEADYDEKLVKSLYPKERQLWNVEDTSEPGVCQVWDVSHFLFGKAIKDKVNNADDGEYDFFSDPVDGMMLKIGATEETGGGYKFLKFADIEFKTRVKPLDKALLDQAHCLDDMVKEISYEDLYKIFHQQADEGNKPKREPSNGKPKRPERPAAKEPPPDDAGTASDDDDKNIVAPRMFVIGSFIKHDEHGICEVIRVLSDGTLRLSDANEEIINKVDPNECEPHMEGADGAEGGDDSADDSGNGKADDDGDQGTADAPPVNEDDDGFGDPDDDAPPPPKAKPKPPPPGKKPGKK